MKTVTLTALAAKLHGSSVAMGYPPERAAWSAGDYKLRFFTEKENQLLGQLVVRYKVCKGTRKERRLKALEVI